MPLRFRRTLRIAPGLKINFSKGGMSTTVGTRNIHFNFGKHGVRRTLSLPGTGLSEVDYIKKNENENSEEKEEAKERREERAAERRREHPSEAAIPDTGHAAAHRQLGAASYTGSRNFFVLLAIAIFFFAGAAVLGLLPAHFFSNVFLWMAHLVRGSGL